MKTKQQMYNRFLHHNMAIVGGFLAGYAVLIHSNFLGNAQTSNLIFFVFSILKRNLLQAVLAQGSLFYGKSFGISYRCSRFLSACSTIWYKSCMV